MDVRSCVCAVAGSALSASILCNFARGQCESWTADFSRPGTDTWVRAMCSFDDGSGPALFVAGVVVYVSWRLARRTVDALLDAAPPGVRSKIYDAVLRVERCHQDSGNSGQRFAQFSVDHHRHLLCE